jgi:hypothetical protein
MKRFRVIPGGKSLHGPPDNSKPGLYRAHSTGRFVKGDSIYEDVLFHWYCLERAVPAVDYPAAIAGYEQMDEELRRPFERFVDRHFTEDEVVELGAYLAERYGLDVRSERIELPVKDRGFLFEEGSAVIYEFLELSERPGYSLPFKVWGYFTLHERMEKPMLDDGVELVEEVLRKLGVALPVGRAHLESILKNIYEDRGLVVKRFKQEDEE